MGQLLLRVLVVHQWRCQCQFALQVVLLWQVEVPGSLVSLYWIPHSHQEVPQCRVQKADIEKRVMGVYVVLAVGVVVHLLCCRLPYQQSAFDE